MSTNKTRPDWNDYFMGMAKWASSRATCDRKKVGAVIVRHNDIISTGYNGSPKGLPHCDDVGHELKQIGERQSCIRTLHAESNAIDRAGRQTDGATLYTLVYPCYDCAKRIINAGIVRVYYDEFYESRNTALVQNLFTQAGLVMTQMCAPTLAK